MKNGIVYGIIEETFILGEISRKSYGIAAFASADEDGTATIVAAVNDISDDREKIENCVKLYNDLGLDIVHLEDVIEDLLAE